MMGRSPQKVAQAATLRPPIRSLLRLNRSHRAARTSLNSCGMRA
jgi:hypothetical protein